MFHKKKNSFRVRGLGFTTTYNLQPTRLDSARDERIKRVEPRRTTLFFILFALSLSFFGLFHSQEAKAAFSETPRTDLWSTDGSINATAVGSDGTLYIGGSFGAVYGPIAGGGISIDKTTG